MVYVTSLLEKLHILLFFFIWIKYITVFYIAAFSKGSELEISFDLLRYMPWRWLLNCFHFILISFNLTHTWSHRLIDTSFERRRQIHFYTVSRHLKSQWCISWLISWVLLKLWIIVFVLWDPLVNNGFYFCFDISRSIWLLVRP